jgi:hypothetical protein
VADYVELVRGADAGLFLYDGERYYTRCSGILIEMLSAGVPVITLAGSWLAEEIAEEIYTHQEHVASALAPLGESELRAGLEIPLGTTHLHLALACGAPVPAGAFLRVELRDRGWRSCAIVGTRRADGRPTPVLFALPSGARRVELSWSNAYDERALTIAQGRVRFLSGDAVPLGRTGLIAASLAEVAPLLEELTRHRAHYRESARAFAREYARLHHPRHALSLLLGKARGAAVPSLARSPVS